jgi:subtilisin family serine protease
MATRFVSRVLPGVLALSLVSVDALAGHMSLHLKRVVDEVALGNTRGLDRNGFVSLSTKTVGRQRELYASVLMEAPVASVAGLLRMGVRVHAILPNGVLTADVPVRLLPELAARRDIGAIEPGHRVKMYNDLSNGLSEVLPGVWSGMNNTRAFDGTGVVVGVVDSGLDWSHGDFVDDATGQSRIRYYWDQSDTSDDNPPVGTGWSFTYGHEYVKTDFDAALATCTSWDPATNFFAPMDDPSCPIKAVAGDNDGHGTHVTGTAAGDGSASGYLGAAPKADIVFVKFDFEGDRNTSASIVDAVDYIFKRAAQLGKPAVINMSLGSDYGPHDGSTLEERSLDALTGPGKVVVVAAGNPGANNWSQRLTWGFAMHGDGAMATDPITFRFPTYTPNPDGSEGDYMFLDAWYGGSDTCRVRVTTPSGKVYPPSFSGSYKNTWKTKTAYTGFNTAEGAILVGNGGDQLSWSTNNGDHELYVEISDYYGVSPAVGTWKIEIVPLTTPEGGHYDAWYGVSGNIVKGWQAEPTPRSATPRFGGRESDNRITIGSPASASKVIAAAAYSSRMSWYYYDGKTDQPSTTMQSYDAAPIGYYDPYEVGELTNFSARGPRRDGVLKPEIATPGVGIASAFSHYTRHDEWPARALTYGQPGATYHFGTNRVLPNLEGTILQGTSMACPNATGAIALLLQAKPTTNDTMLRDAFVATARHDIRTDVYQSIPLTAQCDSDPLAGASLPNNDWGQGKLDVAAAAAYLVALPTTDTVVVTAATWNTKKKQLSVTATSSMAPAAALTMRYSYDNGATWLPAAGYAMTYSSSTQKYTKTVALTSKPGLVKVTSSKGGAAQKTVQ